jgi:uncharacterized membrane protein
MDNPVVKEEKVEEVVQTEKTEAVIKEENSNRTSIEKKKQILAISILGAVAFIVVVTMILVIVFLG